MAKKGVLQFLNSDGTYSDAYPKTSYDKVEGLDDHVKTVKVNSATTADKATGNAGTATKLATARTIALSGGATGTATPFDGSANISIPVTSLDASKLTGTAAVNTTGTAAKATNDVDGTAIKSYLKSAGLTFPSLTFTKGDGTATDLLLVPDGAGPHNALYRGKDLTAYFDSGEMSKAIAAGTFRDIFPGDYIIKSVTINGTTYSNVKWLVAGCDYHLGCGDSETTAHHVVLIADTPLFAAVMNDTNITTGGYVGSKMWGTTIPLVATGVQSAFGSEHVLSHRELLSNTESDTVGSGAGAGWAGGTTNWMWQSVLVNIPNEPMVYGTKVLSSSFFDVGDCKTQLPLFRHSEKDIVRRSGLTSGTYWGYWLRAVASSTLFCRVYVYGYVDFADASNANLWVRPYFLFR